MTEVIESVHLTSSGQVKASQGMVYGVVLNGGSAAATVELAPATAGGGTAKIKLSAPANDSRSFSCPNGIKFDTGIYATLAGTGASVTVAYS